MKALIISYGIENRWIYRHSGFPREWDPERVSIKEQAEYIKRIVKQTGAKIVLTSNVLLQTDRKIDIAEFAKYGIPIHDIIQSHHPLNYSTGKDFCFSGDDIYEYLTSHKEIEQYVILGIGQYVFRLRNHTLGVHPCGLNARDVERAIEILNSKNVPLQISILGDSISTYEGFNPVGFDVYYKGNKLKENNLNDVNQTWWMQVIRALGGELCINNSYAGSFVYETCEFSVSANQRCCALHNGDNAPNVILVYAGTNDCLSAIDENDFYDSYLTMLKRLRNRYPRAEIFCATLLIGNKENSIMTNQDFFLFKLYNNLIRKAVTANQVGLVELAKYKEYYPALDGVHPTKEGHELLADFWLNCLRMY